MENAVSSEEIFKKADEYYKSLSKDRLESLTRKGFQQELIEKYGKHFVISKDDFAKLKDHLRFMKLSDEWRAIYGNIVWCKTHKNYPW